MGDQPKPVHGHEDTVDAGEGNPEVEFAQRLVQAAAKKFGEPEEQGAKNGEGGRDAHDKMEKAGDKIAANGRNSESVRGGGEHGKPAGGKKGKENQSEKQNGGEGG